MLKTLIMKAAFIAFVGSVSFAAHAVADTPRIDVPAGDLIAALESLAKQADVDLVYQAEQVKGFRTGGVSGNLSPTDAVAKLLEGTPLGIHTDQASGAILITTPASNPSSSPRSAEGEPTNESSESPTAQAQGEKRAAWNRLRIAQAEPPSQSSSSTERATNVSDSRDQQAALLDEIVVVGSRLGISANQSPQLTKVITRQDIEASGASNVSQALIALPEVSMIHDGTNSSSGGSTIRLRGLPVSTALVLVNGRRIGITGSQTSFGYFDLNSIPLASVERIEVLTVGSSAIHGGDALGGVVNIVLKKDFNGIVADIRYGNADGYDETQATLEWGTSWSRGSLSIRGTYAENSELARFERSITESQDFREFGARDLRVANSNPGNIYSRTSANLPGLNATFAAVPAGSDGVGLTPGDFAGTAGTLNSTSLGSYGSFLAPAERYGISAYANQQLTSSAEAFAEMLYSSTERTHYSSPAILSRRRVPASNPFNPFGVDVLADFMLEDAGRVCSCYYDDYIRPLVGLRGGLAAWDWEIAGWLSRNWTDATNTNQVNLPAVDAALASTNPETALNVFQDGPGGSPALISSLLTSNELEYYSDLRAANAYLRGPLTIFDSRTVNLVIGGEYTRDAVDYLPNDSVFGFKADRDSYAFFGEARIPLWRNHKDPSTGDILALSGALRYDHYSDFGSRTSPGAGLEFRPFRSVLFRASYSSSFKPPLHSQLYAPRLTFNTTITDPALGNASYATSRIFGGNASLDAQTGSSKSVGIVFSPSALLGGSISLSHWDIRLEKGPTNPTPQYIVDNPDLYPGRIQRDPVTGRITALDATFINFGYIDEAGFDFTFGWRSHTGIGAFNPELSVTNTYHYEVQAVVNAPPTDSVSAANTIGFAPRWKGTASVGWEHGALQATVVGRYVGEYRDYAALTSGLFQSLGDDWFVDVNARYELGKALSSRSQFLSGLYVTVGAVNVLDELPPFSNSGSLGIDDRQSDLRGRFVYGHVGIAF